MNLSELKYNNEIKSKNDYVQAKRIWRRYSIAFSVSCAFLVFVSSCLYISEKKHSQEIERLKTEYEQQILQTKNDLTEEFLAQELESENEIDQLRDRIAFLSVAGAVYEPVKEDIEEEQEQKQEEKVETTLATNWQDYINLFTIGQYVPLPENIDTNTFRCMDYRTITDRSSWQYEIQLLSHVEQGSGLRYYPYNGEKYYTVALATAYGIDLGNAYKVTLVNGTTFNIMHAEYKHDIRYPSPTDFGDPDKNYDGENTISVIEFIYDWDNAPKGLIADGEANRYLGEDCDIYGDGCNIMKMEYLGKIWSTNS